jgi:hypothetical protein
MQPAVAIRGDPSEPRGLLTGPATTDKCQLPISDFPLPNWVRKACLLDGKAEVALLWCGRIGREQDVAGLPARKKNCWL